jgi:hypothetical protein
MRLVRQTELFQRDRYLHAVRRLQRIKLNNIWVLRRPALGDRKCRKVCHAVFSGGWVAEHRRPAKQKTSRSTE